MLDRLPRDGRARVRLGLLIAGGLLALLVPLLANLHEFIDPDHASARYDFVLATEAVVLGLWAVSFNLMLGYTGMVSFAHAAYYGVGAYTLAIFNTRYHGSVLLGLLLAPLVAGLFGFITGIVALRAVRLYFSLLTLAISQLLFVIAFEWYDFTGGDNGVHNLKIPDWLLDAQNLYYVELAVAAFCLVLMYLLIKSPFGAALLSIRENRQRASSVGLNVKAYELAVYTVAATFAGVAGGLYAIYDQQAYPQLLYWTTNAQPVVIALLGGIGSYLGPVLGAMIFTYLSVTIGKNFPFHFDIVLGAIVVAVVLLAPGGFVSFPDIIGRVRNRFRSGGPETPVIETTGEAIKSLQVDKAVDSAAVEVREVARSDQALLTITGLSKAFGGLRAVQDVNITVRQGDLHAVIGPNGAGKSTLFNLITGRLKPSAGRIAFDGRDITGKSDFSIARAGIGRAFQITNIFPKLSVRHNLQYSMLAFRGITRRPWGNADRIFREEAVELLRSVGLGDYAELPAGQLSHGDQRALELAISIALGSKLLLLDEPTAGMSPYETEKAMELVRRLTTERCLTLLFCEHDMSVVFGTAKTVTVMHQGSVLTEGTPAEVRNNPDVQRVYLGELEVSA